MTQGDDKEGEEAYFLYILDVGEADYPALKRDQSLLVDFAAFPNQFLELIQGCLASSSSSSAAASSPPPNFLARLTIPSATAGVFAIVEANQFKELTHLSLSFRAGTDQTLKAYLATRLRYMTQAHAQASTAHTTTAAALAEAQRHTQSLEDQLVAQRQAKEEEVAALQAAHATALHALSSTHLQETQALTAKREHVTAALQKRLQETEARRAELSEARHGQEATIRELMRQVEGLTCRLQEKEKEVVGLEEAKRRWEAENLALARTGQELEVKVGGLAQQLADQGEVLAQTKALQASAETSKKRMEEALELYKNNALTLQEKLETSVTEIQKGNAIIHKLQGETQALKAKIKTKNEVLKKQEALLSTQRRGVDVGAHRLATAVHENERLTQALAQATATLEEARKENESNQQVITWLNKEINDLQLGRGSSSLLRAAAAAGSGGGGSKYHPHNTSLGSASVATYIPSYHTTPMQPLRRREVEAEEDEEEEEQGKKQQQPPQPQPCKAVDVSASSMSSATSTHYLDALGLSDPFQQ